MPDISDEVRAHLALALVPGLGPKTTAALLAAFGSPAAALTATAARLRELPHVGDKTAADLAAGLRAVDVDAEVRLMDRFGVRAVPAGFPGYPPPLTGLSDPPPLLYFRGEWTDADLTAVGVVGTRRCTPYGRRVTEQICRGLVRAGVTVVSGLARGIDGIAHRAALEAGGRTLAVVAGGLASTYPPEHAGLADAVAASGAVLTEFPMTADPLPGSFHARNRIISGLSRGVVVVEADVRSGALITARHALEQGREVFAVPGPTDSPASAGCLELIRAGARLVRSADDILDDLKGISTADYAGATRKDPTPRPPPPLGEGEKDTPDLFSPTLGGQGEGLSSSSSPSPRGGGGRGVGSSSDSPSPRGGGGRGEGSLPPAPPSDLNPAQQKVWDLLASRRQADELTRETGLPPGELFLVLMQLQQKRLVRQLPGNAYERA
ncbi:MAG: DNA-processing protein DprA [Gemmataceae bacterium]|nr:DNA-processing protein DprA [Gemmataceae bacterium]